MFFRTVHSGIARHPDLVSRFAAFAHERFDYWMAGTADDAPGGFPAAVALLRAVYDMVDAVKALEAEGGLDGTEMFRQVCEGCGGARLRRDLFSREQAANQHTAATISSGQLLRRASAR